DLVLELFRDRGGHGDPSTGVRQSGREGDRHEEEEAGLEPRQREGPDAGDRGDDPGGSGMAIVASRDDEAGHHRPQARYREDEPELTAGSPEHVTDVDDQEGDDPGK